MKVQPSQSRSAAQQSRTRKREKRGAMRREIRRPVKRSEWEKESENLSGMENENILFPSMIIFVVVCSPNAMINSTTNSGTTTMFFSGTKVSVCYSWPFDNSIASRLLLATSLRFFFEFAGGYLLAIPSNYYTVPQRTTFRQNELLDHDSRSGGISCCASHRAALTVSVRQSFVLETQHS